MPDDDHVDSVDTILAQFDKKKELLDAFCGRTKALIEECLKDAGVRYQSVQARRKRTEKLRLKYLDPQKQYRCLDDITDQVALRVITYYEDEIDRVAAIIKREFEIDPQRSVDKRETQPDRFGYYALNLICRHAERRRGDVEYKRFADVVCEIQVTSVLRHAWSEIEHDWYDSKHAYPDLIKRRFYRLAALLEIAESEFTELRNKKSTYKQSVAIQIHANVPDVPIDAVSLFSFTEQDALVRNLDEELAALRAIPLTDGSPAFSVMPVLLLKEAGISTIQDLRRSLSSYEKQLRSFVDRSSKEVWTAKVSTSLTRGASLVHLAVLLISAKRSPQEVMEVFRKVQFPWPEVFSIEQQVNIAHEVTRSGKKN